MNIIEKLGITPRPWKSYKQEVSGIYGVGVGWFGDNGMYGKDGCHTISKKEAGKNARLCAAAPEMLEALIDQAKHYDFDLTFDRMKAIAPVIKKATGKTLEEIKAWL